MKKLRGSLFSRTGVRVVLALAIAVANVAVFGTSSPAAAKGCYDCMYVPGGATGWVVDCVFGDTGELATCRERFDDCVGYRCAYEGEATEMEFEPKPLASLAPAGPGLWRVSR
jgi:hypothetical protein